MFLVEGQELGFNQSGLTWKVEGKGSILVFTVGSLTGFGGSVGQGSVHRTFRGLEFAESRGPSPGFRVYRAEGNL